MLVVDVHEHATQHASALQGPGGFVTAISRRSARMALGIVRLTAVEWTSPRVRLLLSERTSPVPSKKVIRASSGREPLGLSTESV